MSDTKKNDRRLIDIVNNRKFRLPPRLLAKAIILLFRFLIRKTDYKFVYEFDIQEFKDKQTILIADHASREIYQYVLAGFPYRSPNTVVGFHNLFAKWTFSLLLKSGVILKYLYVPDLRSTKQMLWVLKNGGNLCIFPEGIQSASGSMMPMNPGTIRFLKKAGVDVILCKSYGAYLCSPRYRRDKGFGPQEFHYEHLFTPEELKAKTEDELYRKYLKHFGYNDFKWNQEHRHRYVFENGIAKGIEGLLYHCPKCHSEFQLIGESNEIVCRVCGNRILLNEYYDLIPDADSICPYASIDTWFKNQRCLVREEIQCKDFEISYEAYFRALHYDKLYDDQEYTIGKGQVTINRQGIRYTGFKNGERVDLLYDMRGIPSIIFIPNENNCFYYAGEYVLLQPISDPLRVVKYMLIVEELHNLIDPKWNAVCRDAYDR